MRKKYSFLSGGKQPPAKPNKPDEKSAPITVKELRAGAIKIEHQHTTQEIRDIYGNFQGFTFHEIPRPPEILAPPYATPDCFICYGSQAAAEYATTREPRRTITTDQTASGYFWQCREWNADGTSRVIEVGEERYLDQIDAHARRLKAAGTCEGFRTFQRFIEDHVAEALSRPYGKISGPIPKYLQSIIEEMKPQAPAAVRVTRPLSEIVRNLKRARGYLKLWQAITNPKKRKRQKRK